MGSLVLLDLMGGVALLLWGLHMVHSGILRAFGPDLRQLLAKALNNRLSAFAAGLGLTAILQSSTATALITSSFTAEGLVGLVPALAIMLGANVGTTLIVQLLSFNIAAVAPVLFVLGLVAFRSGPRSRIKDLGRVSIGLGLMLLSLHILLDTLAPAESAPGARVFMSAITGDPVLCILIGAIVTWIVHSSVASVLLIMSLAYAHFISPYASLALVLGRQSRQRHQSHSRRRPPRQSRKLSPAARQPHEPAGRRAAGHALPAATRRSVAGAAARPRETHRRISHRLQCRDGDRLHWPARRHGAAPDLDAAGSGTRGGSRRGRAISTRPRWRHRRWRSPMPRAKRCAWAMPSKPCCARS